MAGRIEPAIASFESVLQQDAAHADAQLYLARIYYQRGQFDRAWTYARQAEALGASAAELIAALRRVSVEPE